MAKLAEVQFLNASFSNSVAFYLMSIKPKFGEEILAGVKKYELRRLAGPLIEPGDHIFLYFTRPVAAVAGHFVAGVVFLAPVENLPRLLKELGDVGIGEEDLKYVEGARYAMLIEAKNRARCAKLVKPADVGLRPPPSYRRIDKRSADKLLAMCNS
jgi:predicted transcriptional regulator